MEYPEIMFDEQAEVVFNHRLTADTWLMGMRSASIAKVARPGQFVMIRVSRGIDPLLRRPFSIGGIEKNLFLVLCQVVGRGTGILAQIKDGERLSVLGPLGKGFELPARGTTPILVGGGIGVAPLCFLAQSLGRTKAEFMMGFASAKAILRLKHIRTTHIKISLSTDDGTKGHAGFVTDLLDKYLKKRGLDKGALSLFACGPKLMLKKVAQIASGYRLSCQVSLEASMACGLGACQGCAVKASQMEGRPYYHVCEDGPVFEAGAIDWDNL
jgi:dihydroorotate dehydrogenase electron transfer subunit